MFLRELDGIIVGGWTTVRPHIFVEKGPSIVLGRTEFDYQARSVVLSCDSGPGERIGRDEHVALDVPE